MKAIARTVEQSAGLYWGAGTQPASNPVPLEGVKVHADLAGHGSRVTMVQRFRNAETVPIEAVYVFPLPEAAAISGLAIHVGDRRIEGEIDRRDKAFDRFDDAMAEGHGAALLDQERPNVFTISVGNILPAQEAVIELTWVAELPMEGEAIRFLLPTAVAPRYAPDEDRRGVSPTPAEQVSPPIALDVPYGLALDVDVSLACGIRSVDSPSHPVRVEMDGSRARVTLSHERTAMDRDFVLLVTPQEAGRPQVLVERNDDGLVTAGVSFVPRLESAPAPVEVVFVVDRSGSMGGSSIEQVRAALQLCLRSLRSGDRFNIVGFGSTFEMLFPESVPYEQGTLGTAAEHVAQLDADLGGTEILPALQAVLEREPAPGLRRQVVLLTDGEVSNEAAVVELAERHRAHTRIFTFGIGYGASEHLVRSLARVTLGQAEFIHPGERIEPKVLRQFARLGTAAVRDVRVEWKGSRVRLQAPYRPASVFDGEAIVVYARLEAGGAVTAILSGDAEGTPVSWSLPVDLAAADRGSLLATLAARAAIRDLEDGTSALHDRPRGSAQRGRREERVADAIAELAMAHGLVSSGTSFVAIERREAGENQPAAALRRVPVQLTAGWGGVDRATGGIAAQLSASQALGRASHRFACLLTSPADAPTADSLPSFARASFDSLRPAASRARYADAVRPDAPQERLRQLAPPPCVPPSHRPHVAVAVLQRADGSWHLDEEFAGVVGASLKGLRSLAKTIGTDAEARAIVATIAALLFLETRAGDARNEWRLLAAKADAWVVRALASRPSVDRAALERAVSSLLS